MNVVKTRNMPMDPKPKIGAWEGNNSQVVFNLERQLDKLKNLHKGYITYGHSRANINCHIHDQELEKCLLHVKQLLQKELECIWMQ